MFQFKIIKQALKKVQNTAVFDSNIKINIILKKAMLLQEIV